MQKYTVRIIEVQDPPKTAKDALAQPAAESPPSDVLPCPKCSGPGIDNYHAPDECPADVPPPSDAASVTCSGCIHFGAICEWVDAALDGRPVSDFAESFSLVRKAMDAFAVQSALAADQSAHAETRRKLDEAHALIAADSDTRVQIAEQLAAAVERADAAEKRASEDRAHAAELETAMQLISGALCDSKAVVPEHFMGFADAIREITKRADESEAACVAYRKALTHADEALRNREVMPSGHSGDEDSPTCDPDCGKCAAESARAHIGFALAPTAGTALLAELAMLRERVKAADEMAGAFRTFWLSREMDMRRQFDLASKMLFAQKAYLKARGIEENNLPGQPDADVALPAPAPKKEHCPRRLMGEFQPPHSPCDTGDHSRDDDAPAPADGEKGGGE